MARKRRAFLLDDRILAELDGAAKAGGYASINQFVEAGLFKFLQASGRIPTDAVPLPEMRGGSRKKMGGKE